MCRAIWPCRDCVQEALEDSLSEERCEFFGPTFRDHMERHMCHLHLYTCTITPLHLHICKCRGVDAFACNYTFVFLTVEDADDDDKEKLNDEDNDDGFDDNEDDDEYEYMSLNMNMNLCIYVCVCSYVYLYIHIYIYIWAALRKEPFAGFWSFFPQSISKFVELGPGWSLWGPLICCLLRLLWLSLLLTLALQRRHARASGGVRRWIGMVQHVTGSLQKPWVSIPIWSHDLDDLGYISETSI